VVGQEPHMMIIE